MKRSSHSNPTAEDRRQWLVVLAVGTYVLCFYVAESLLKPIPIKSRALAWLFLPDELATQWVGGDISRFGLLDRFPVLFGTATILVLGFLCGRLVLDGLRIDRRLNRLETLLASLGVGLNLLSVFTLSIGLAGWLQQPAVFVGLGLSIAALGLLRCRSWCCGQSAEVSSSVSGWPKLGALAGGLAVPFVLLILWGGMLPPWQFDVREYHLQVPKEWFQAGRITFLPHNVYGNMPLGAEMHVLLAMALFQGWCEWWWGALIGKTVIASFAPLTALAVYSLGSRFISPAAGTIAAFVFISTPWIAHVSMAGLIEGAYAFYLVLAVHCILLSTTRPLQASREAPTDDNRFLLLLAGFLAGSAVSCKYPALAFVVVPLFLWTVFSSMRAWFIGARSVATGGPKLDGPETVARSSSRLPLGWIAVAKPPMVFVIGAVLACGLWFGKNWVQTKNPTYPLLYEWFDGRTRTPEKHEQWSRAHRAPAGGWNVSRLADSATTVVLTSDYLSPALVPLAMLGLCSRQYRRLVLPLAALLAVVFAVWWCLTHRLDRFLLPLLPLAAVLAGVGAIWSFGVVWRRTLYALLISSCLANACLVSSRDVSDNRFFVSLRELRHDRESVHDRGYFHLHRAHDKINEIVQPGFVVLLVGEAQLFNIEVAALYNTCFDDCLFESMMKDRSRSERLEILRSQRISHVFFFWRELDRYRSPGNYGYSNYATRDRVHREFVQHQELLRPVAMDTERSSSELFEVVGWRTFAATSTTP